MRAGDSVLTRSRVSRIICVPRECEGVRIRPWLFPSWVNDLRWIILVAALVVPGYVALVLAYGASPNATDVGYMPTQPVPYSHAMHADGLGMDCRYCHTSVEGAAHANVPPTKVCMNCHVTIFGKSAKLEPVRESYTTGLPVQWIRVHDLPDYVYFDHSIHVQRGVGCVTCHGRIDKMEVVFQAQPLSMSWCLDCHRQPELYLRPTNEVTNMSYMPPAGNQRALGLRLKSENNIRPATDCSACHR